MREILFRGKRTDTGEWVEGFYSNELYANKHYISKWYYGSYAELQKFEVIPETVGQYTGLCDANGKKLFEGDIIKNIAGYVYSGSYTCTVDWQCGWFCGYGLCVDIPPESFKYCEVIGNIHDNPELLN